jgi:hypothetical protein
MASTPSDDKPRAMTLEEFGRDVMRRREKLGNVEVPRNTGQRRTPSKRTLLDAIARTGGKW